MDQWLVMSLLMVILLGNYVVGRVLLARLNHTDHRPMRYYLHDHDGYRICPICGRRVF